MAQTFSLLDLPILLVLTLLEILLSADNAIVLALFAHQLPKEKQNRALFIGFISAFFLRALALLLTSFLISFLWFKLIGALYLLYLSARYWWQKASHTPKKRDRSTPYWRVVLQIELFDLLFAIDSILAGVAFITTPEGGVQSSKLWIVYVGGMIGALLIRYAATLFTRLISNLPYLEAAAHAMIGWIGLKLGAGAFSLTFPYFSLVFWVGLLLMLAWGLIPGQKRMRT